MKKINMESPIFQFFTQLSDYILLNLCMVICCIPIFTIGSSVTAMYYACAKTHDDCGHALPNFLKAFCSNFKQATLLWLIMLLSGFPLFACMAMVLFQLVSMGKLLLFLLAWGVIFWFMILAWVFPLQAKFHNTIKGTLTNAVLCAFGYFHRSLMMAAVNIVPLFFLVVLPKYYMAFGVLWLLIWYTVSAKINLFFLKKPFDTISPPQNTVTDSLP